MKELGLKPIVFLFHGHESFQQVMAKSIKPASIFYNAVIDTLLENDILPFVTLYHFDLPFALVEKYNGWADRRCVSAFQRYAQVCYQAFGDRVKNWQVTNEQNLMIRVDERMNMYDVAPENVEKFVHKWITICLLPMR